jgi:HAE1 family hydrophobic/amphiphilic exporter-1
MRIDGVAEVTVFGRPEREVIIEFDQDALRSHGLGLYQVVSRLQASSLNISVGEMIEGRTKYYVRVLGEFRRPEEMAELVVGPNGLRLKNVARVGYKPRERDEEFTVDRKGSVFVLVVKESEANTIATCDAVKAELERIEQEPDFLGLRHAHVHGPVRRDPVRPGRPPRFRQGRRAARRDRPVPLPASGSCPRWSWPWRSRPR